MYYDVILFGILISRLSYFLRVNWKDVATSRKGW